MPEIITYTHLPMGLMNPVWDMYEAAMAPLRKLAIQKHVMHVDEFVHCMADERVVKYLGQGDDGRISGLTVSTNVLEAWPYIEPEYLEHHWPEPYAGNRIWYVGFLVSDRQDREMFEALRAAVARPVRAAGGMAFMDFCEYNEDVRHLPQVAATAARREDQRARVRKVDSQGYWIFSYDGSEVPVDVLNL